MTSPARPPARDTDRSALTDIASGAITGKNIGAYASAATNIKILSRAALAAPDTRRPIAAIVTRGRHTRGLQPPHRSHGRTEMAAAGHRHYRSVNAGSTHDPRGSLLLAGNLRALPEPKAVVCHAFIFLR